MDDSPNGFKRCVLCHVWQKLDAFNKKARAKDGHQSVCRACNKLVSKKYYAARTDEHRANVRKQKALNRAMCNERMFQYLRGKQCVDCGENDPIVLDFDHLRDKTMAVSGLIRSGFSWHVVLNEIAKCEIVCANCHRRRTAGRGNHYRHRLKNGDLPPEA